jgi:hypothetical protein
MQHLPEQGKPLGGHLDEAGGISASFAYPTHGCSDNSAIPRTLGKQAECCISSAL